jgi:hypothetical protein
MCIKTSSQRRKTSILRGEGKRGAFWQLNGLHDHSQYTGMEAGCLRAGQWVLMSQSDVQITWRPNA